MTKPSKSVIQPGVVNSPLNSLAVERKADTERGRRIGLIRFQLGTEGSHSSPRDLGIVTKRRLLPCLQRETAFRGRANHLLGSHHHVSWNRQRRLRLANTSCPPWISHVTRPRRQASTGLVRPRRPRLARFRRPTRYQRRQQRTRTCSNLPATVGKVSTTHRPVEYNIRGCLPISSHLGRHRA